jgi:hypothetical protein
LALPLPFVGTLELSNLLFGVVIATILGVGVAGVGLARFRRPQKASREAQAAPAASERPLSHRAQAAFAASAPGKTVEIPKDGGSLLDFFSKGAIQELRPTSDAQYGVRYIEIENLTKVEPRNVPALLERLAARGVLLRRTYERKIVCEICSSKDLSPRYECTTCKSTNLERERVIEHVTCGHTGSEGQFGRRGDLLVCSHCDGEFRSSGPEVNIKVSEIIYSCQDCGASTRQPGIYFQCAGCGAIVPVNGVAFANLYSYALARNGDLQSVVLLELISSMLKEMDYQVEIPGTLQGKSGIQHKFGLVFSVGGQVGAVSVVQIGSTTDELGLKDIFTSVFDCSPSFHVLITIPNAGDSVKKLANQYKTHVIEGGDVKGILRLFRSYAIGLRSSAQGHQRQTAANGAAAVATVARRD